MQLGTTFDIEQAYKFGLDFGKALQELINLGISPIRIGIKWNRVITQKSQQDWDDYDKMFEILHSSKVPTILQVGMKSPQWPEFYIPKWVEEKEQLNGEITTQNKFLVENLLDFIAKTLKRYDKLTNIKWIQIENEPFLKIPPFSRHIGIDLLEEELRLVRQLTNLPILLTDQGLPTTGILAEYAKGRFNYKKKLLENSDTFGLNVFPKIRGLLFGIKEHAFSANSLAWLYLQKWLHRAEKTSKECWVTELQAEPWGPKKLDFKNAYSDTTCNPEMVRAYLERLKHMGFETILIWGSEFHLACEKQGNSEWLEQLYRNYTALKTKFQNHTSRKRYKSNQKTKFH